MKIHNIFSLFFVIATLVSCSDKSEYVELQSVNGSWDKNAEQKFNFNITDNQQPRNIIFVVRNNNDYPYSNIRLIVDFLNVKTKAKQTDTLNYILAEPNGAWLGKGFGDTKEILFQYKVKYKFPNAGEYSIGIKQAMRQDKLRGIEDIGVKINTAKP